MANETPADFIERWMGASLRELGRRARVDHTVLREYQRGRVPQLEMALRIADNLRLEPEERAAWFEACGLEDPRSGELTYEPILDGMTIQAFRDADLPPEDIAVLNEEMRRLIAEKRRKRGY